MLHEVTDVDEVDEHGGERRLVLRVLAAHDTGELPVVDGDGLEQRRRERVVRVLADGEDGATHGMVHVHERVLRDFFRLVVCHRSLLPGWFYRMLVFYHTPGNPLKIMSVKREATCPSIFGENPMKGRCTGRREEYWFTV